jgi:membrane associated rhomboid family serine protease
MIPLRDSTRSSSFPFVTILLIVANAALFVKELGLMAAHPEALEGFVAAWGIVPVRFLADPWTGWVTIVSSMFLHGGWSHIIGNMLYLWIFGDNVEDRMGHFRFLIFYLLVGAAAALSQIYFNPSSQVPMIGASGAIAGVLGAYFVLFPKARVLTLIPLGFFTRMIEVPAFLFLGLWFVIQSLQGVGSLSQRAFHGDVGGVAWWAHAGGFVAGLLLVWVFKKRKKGSYF